MPIHDWTKVEAGVFHDFHLSWIGELKRALNAGLLPADYYALAEQRTGEFGPDVLTLRGPQPSDPESGNAFEGGVAVATAPPKVRYRSRMPDAQWYALKADRLVVRHVSGHEVVAVVELMSPGNKSSVKALDDFLRKAWSLMRAGVHLLVVDPFPPTARDPSGIHDAIWEDGTVEVERSPAQLLTCASYRCGREPEAFVEPVAVGDALPDMPLFLTEDVYILTPLERTYESAWTSVPNFYRRQLT